MSIWRLHPWLAGVALALVACTTPAPPEPPPATFSPAPATPPPPRVAEPLRLSQARERCVALARRTLDGVQTLRSEFIAGGIAYPVHEVSRRIVGAALPEHCLVRGTLAAAGDGAVAFEMRLPADWNGRFLNQGRHDAGAPLIEAYGRNTGAAGLDDNALSRGFAVLASDAGGPLDPAPKRPTAARHDDAAFTLARAAYAGKALIGAYYGRAPGRSYFVGCSDGGRDGLSFAQHWPWVFDGIVAVSPTLREADAALANAWTLQRFAAAAPRSRQRTPVLSQAFSVEDLFVVSNAILRRCDALDGAADGFVMDMAACRFDPAELQCRRRASKDCLDARQVKALRDAMAGPRDAAGQPLYAAWPWDPGIAAPGWRVWTLGDAPAGEAPDARHATRTSAALGRDFVTPPDAQLDLFSLDFQRDLPRLRAAREAGLASLNLSLDAFRQRQGRLVMVHGAADPVVSAWATVDYQRRLDQAQRSETGAAHFARSFIVPGMNHCAGGPATDRFDALAAVVKWVEFEQPPDRIEARGSAVLRDESRPLCPWPQVARYRGQGSLHDSASYACR